MDEDVLEIMVVATPEAATVLASGEVDLFTVDRLRRAVSVCLQRGGRRVVVDLSGVTFVDGHSLNVLIQLTNAARAAGISLVLRNPSAGFERVKRLVDFDEALQVEAV
jgi:anti-sigma B factor antagonist